MKTGEPDLARIRDGSETTNRDDQRSPAPDGEKRLRAEVEKRFGKEVAAQPFYALVNVGAPQKSRVLLAALPTDKGGWGQFDGGFKGTDDPDYQALLALVQGAIAPQAYQDFHGTCGRGTNCVCNSCWVWMGHLNEPGARLNK